MPKLTMESQTEFLKVAHEEGVDAAVTKYPALVPDDEIEALRTLDLEEIRGLYTVSQKMTDAKKGALAGKAMKAWTCVNAVC